MSAAILGPVEARLRPVAEAFVPEIAGVDGEEWREIVGVMERALSDRPREMRRQLLLFLRVLDWLPVLRRGSRLGRLDRAERTEILETLQDSRFLLIRRGVWGLRTLVFMGYYARPGVHSRIGYRAHPDGWSARPEGHEARGGGGSAS